ncbi:ribosome recycling factor [Alkalihalobacillus trypoxylicola]|uniref:Ribosome-recycling factor n=1 Tax=Alkalihalobacillus trypoxylicola TaxID=519424 RepID=A0A162F8D2_9BACI|nr:ribosome recycling factor [Alkalihalobacillus trypoxylicola]KYG35030.1 ribosome recycling factor [Alkalihalobacillus trypoxylicola]GAF63683.1 ribosome recycling factor [Bacillus sp. TS-2]
MSTEIINSAQDRMNKAVDALNRELAKLRAGRANPALLDRVTVEYYGAETPLNQLATISVPEARLLTVQPFDKSSINDIERAILKADLGLTPSNDGTIIRIAIPALTEERRKELVKLVKRSAEEGKVAVRNVRRDANDELKKSQKDGDLTEDDLRRYTDEVQKLTDKTIEKMDGISANKEKEIMEV